MLEIDASALPRIVQCGASKTMPGFTPPGMEYSDDREQGIAAHWLAMQRLGGLITDTSEMIDRKAPNGYYISSEMTEHVDGYVSKILSRSGDRFVEMPHVLRGPDVLIKCRPDVIIDDERGNAIYIDDFKYGWRTIEPYMNWTMLAYAMAFASVRSFASNVRFVLTIYQPRPYHPEGISRSWSIHLTDLIALQQWLMPYLAANQTTLQTGSNCYRCPALSNCPAARNAGMTAVDISQEKFNDQLTPDQMTALLDTLDDAEQRIKNYKTALKERVYDHLSRGGAARNYKLMPNSGNLEWHEWVTPEILAVMYPEKPVTKLKSITPTQAKKLLPENVIDTMSDRPGKGVKLVRIDTQKLAQKMFGKGQ